MEEREIGRRVVREYGMIGERGGVGGVMREEIGVEEEMGEEMERREVIGKDMGGVMQDLVEIPRT